MADRITLEDLRPAEGSTGKSKRVGRGRSSGHGKTSCRGHNGEGQRSGRSSKRGFEGGQMPAYRRLPKLKGFQIINARNYAEINVGRLAELDMCRDGRTGRLPFAVGKGRGSRAGSGDRASADP